MTTKRLSDIDARAVDLLLDRDGSGKSNGNGGSGPVADDHTIKLHLEAAERVLAALSHCPSHDPSTDLIDRTLQRLEDQATRAPSPAVRPPAPGIRPYPHA